MSADWDVIVVGGGPGGAIAAMKCARSGLKTLLLEKSRMPRKKVCSGIVMAHWAQDIITNELGEIPLAVLSSPGYLAGFMIHVPGAEPLLLDNRMPLTWRRELDYWLTCKAKEAGAQIWDGARLTGLRENNEALVVELTNEGERQELQTDFLIGADGALSAVRKSLFPTLDVIYSPCYRECYDVELDISREHFHLFSYPGLAPYYFCVHYKEDHLLLEMGASPGDLKRMRDMARQFMIDNYGLGQGIEPLWKDGCLEPILYRGLFSGSFLPASGNTLLIGDAAGLQIPLSGEGIAPALKSAIIAAESIAESRASGKKAGAIYIDKLADLIARMRNTYPLSRKVREEAEKGPVALSKALLDAWDTALNKLY